MEWTTPDGVRKQVEKYWARGDILSATVTGVELFPLPLRLRRPDTGALAKRFDEVRRWIRALEDGSKPRLGFGYEIEWEERDLRQLGRNRVPRALVVPTKQDALQLTGKRRQSERFDELRDATLLAFPMLREWLAKRPLRLVENAGDWERVLSVLAWFRDHPRPGVYLRQLDIPGVDTKFIEFRRKLLSELLDIVLTSNPAVTVEASVMSFDERYGLRAKPVPIRFRILDPRHRLGALSDIATPVIEFAALDLGIRRVFITENETNGLALPDTPDSIAIFGLGYGLERLAQIRWLQDKAVHYWGDIDTHGFAMLDRVRAVFPAARSLLMDRETLLAHRHLWGREEAPYRHAPLSRLTAVENALFDDLLNDRLGGSVRLEQERIAFGWVTNAIRATVASDRDASE